MADPHIPFHARASAAPHFQHVGLAIDPPGPLPVIDRKPRQAPNPEPNPIRDFAVFMAGVSVFAERLKAAFAPMIAIVGQYRTEYQAERERLSVRLPAPDK